MNNQWPLLVAIILILGAAAFGFFQREQATSVVNSLGDVSRPLPSSSAATERTASAPVKAAPRPRPPQNPPPGAVAAQPVQPAQPVPAPAQVQPPAPAQVQAPQPANPGPVPRPRAAGRFQVLLDLQEDLKARLGMIPIPLPNGGYKFTMPDALVEVVTTPSWQVTVYNMNAKQQDVETEGFKTLLSAVTSNLGINTNQKPVEAATGKSYLRTVSKMGAISLEKDPATGHTVVIRPMTPTPAVDVAQPAQPQAAPPKAEETPVPAPAAPKKPAADF